MKSSFDRDVNKLLQFLQPLLISSYAVLFTYLSAIGEVSFFEFFVTYLFVLFLSFLLIFLFKFIYKSFYKASFFTSIFLLFFWNVTPISRTLYNFSLFGVQIFRLRYLIPVTLIFLFVLFLRLFKSKEKAYFLSTFFFYPYLILNIFCVFNIAKETIIINKLIQKCDLSFKTTFNAKNKPDIYYIVLDTYLSQEALKQHFDFDNKEFLHSLEKRGFQVLNNAYSNYPETVSSLSATLNMHYHENVESGDLQQFFGLGFYKNRNNLVSKILKSQGYKIINIPSVWGDIPKNNFADIDYYSVWPKRFFANLLERMSIISPFVYLYIGYNSRNVFFDQLKTIENHIKDFAPKFIFAHILMPHAPFVFDVDGGNTNPSDWLDDNKLYLGQLKFINKKIDILIDKILQQSKKPPIIILQADHGLNAGIMFSDYSKINDADKNKLIKSFGILSAVYYPEQCGDPSRTTHCGEILQDSIKAVCSACPPKLYAKAGSPINNFRFIFNNYFGMNFELLKDETFVGPDISGKFIKVEKLRRDGEFFK